MAVVKIGQEDFSLSEIPSSDSQLVKTQTEVLLGSVDLPTLVTDLGRVGNFVRIAYNGVAGHTDLQIEIRAIGVNVTRLCDKSAVTVSRFKTSSTTVLDQLQSTYGFLTGGFEKMALVTLQGVSEVAKDMSTAAQELHNEFDAESKRVEAAHKLTMKAQEKSKKQKQDVAVEASKLKVGHERAESEKTTAEEDFKLCEKRYEVAVAKQDSFEASASNPLKKLANAFTTQSFGMTLFDTESDKKRAKEAREDQLKALEDMSKLRKQRSKALQDIAEFAVKLAECKNDAELADAAIDALQGAMGGLKKLSAVMMRAALFWKEVQVHCENLSKERIQKLIPVALEMPKSERIEFWNNPSFLRDAVRYYAQWVSLDKVCAIYMNKIKETQKELYTYLEENPTDEEAKENVRSLASNFLKDLAEEQKKITEKEFACHEQVAKLQAEIPNID